MGDGDFWWWMLIISTVCCLSGDGAASVIIFDDYEAAGCSLIEATLECPHLCTEAVRHFAGTKLVIVGPVIDFHCPLSSSIQVSGLSETF
jgi:hypothetical protein